MPSGLRLDTDGWLREYDACKALIAEVVQLVQERNMNHPPRGGGGMMGGGGGGGGGGPGGADPEASRLTASARRKLGALGGSLDGLYAWLDGPEASELSEQEKFRRRDLLAALKNRREQIQDSLRRADAAAGRDALLRPSGAPSSSAAAAAMPPRETAQTAPLSERGLLQLQQQTMRAQDLELDHIERAVATTKQVAAAVGEEVDLQARLLDDVEEGVSSARDRLRAATRRAREVARASRASGCRGGLAIFLLVAVLTFVLMVAFKIIRLVG